MGCGEEDGSYREQLFNPSMNTTARIKQELDKVDFVLHIGDMSYAQGYAAIVSVMSTCITTCSFINVHQLPTYRETINGSSQPRCQANLMCVQINDIELALQ